MTSDATPAPTGATPEPRGRALRALVAAAVVVALAWFGAAPALAGLGEPVDPRPDPEEQRPTTTDSPKTTDAEKPSTTVDDETTTTEADETTETTETTDDKPADADSEEIDGAEAASRSEADDDDGTSAAALAAVGVVGFILGLLLAAIPLGLALSRRKASAGQARPATGAAGATPAPAAGGPAIGPAPSRDADRVRQQRVALVEALIALRDKLPSAALGDEAAQALAAAGIHEVRPDGAPFDPAHHRAVHQVPTDDPSRHNTVVSVERPGYSDGVSTIRQPEVVVAVHGGSS